MLLDAVVAAFAPVPTGTMIDATVGGGGHAEALLDAHPHLNVVGLDRDPVAVAAAGARLRRFGHRARVVQIRFDAMDEIVEGLDDVLTGLLADLGFSSVQIDRSERGFSYRNDGPLDMRMDPTSGRTAADIVAELAETELARILRRFGDERHADRIARAIVAAVPIETTEQLAAIVRDAIPAPARRTGGNPATRTFQALRIAVNDELEQLECRARRRARPPRPGGRRRGDHLPLGRGPHRRPPLPATTPPRRGPAGRRAAPCSRAPTRSPPTPGPAALGCAWPSSSNPDRQDLNTATGAGTAMTTTVKAPRRVTIPNEPGDRTAPRPPGRLVAPGRPASSRAGRSGARRASVGAMRCGRIVLGALFALAVVHTLLIGGQLELDTMRNQVSGEHEAVSELRLQVADLEAPERILAEARDSRNGRARRGRSLAPWRSTRR